MAKGKHKKYMRILISLPDDVCENFTNFVPNGQRSKLITIWIKQYLIKKNLSQKKKTFWNELKKYRKGDYSYEDPVKTAKDAWSHID